MENQFCLLVAAAAAAITQLFCSNICFTSY